MGSLNSYSSGAVTPKTNGISNRQNQGVYYFYINGSAMSLDLMPPNTCDPSTVTNARYQVIFDKFFFDFKIIQILKCWVNECEKRPFQQEDLPEFEYKVSNNCTFIYGKYPWGQAVKNTNSGSVNRFLYSSLICYSISMLVYSFY